MMIALTHTVHTLRGMNQKSLLAAVFVSTLALTSVACDDDPAKPRDAGAADRTPDLAVTEGGLDRAPDTTTPTPDGAVDKAPDTSSTDGGVDKAPDTSTDAPADVAADVAVDTAADKAPDTTPDLAPDTTPDTAPDAMADATSDVLPGVLNGCVTYVDRTAVASDTTLTWSMAIATDPERCMKIKVGYTVCWSTSSFATHPLSAAGGDTPTPIMSKSTGLLACYAFPTPGTYGFKCDVHPTMTGAIQVVP
jgi:plastocyanin